MASSTDSPPRSAVADTVDRAFLDPALDRLSIRPEGPDRSLSRAELLRLYRAMPLPPYGDAAQFCFDSATGAMTLFETTSSDGADRTIAEHITPVVTEADFARP